jgi:surfactin synthase thioesterase subunit
MAMTRSDAAATAVAPRWVIRRHPRPDAHGSLYFFPHAGGSPGEYIRWSDDLPGAQVWAVQLPGHGSRVREHPFTRMGPLVEAVVEAVTFDSPCALFGHSLGGLIAYEVARALRDRGQEPQRLFVSSCPPPHERRGGTQLHLLPDADLLAEIERRWGGLPPQVHADQGLREMVLASHRADLELFETYQPGPAEPLTCPLTVIAGDQERDRLDLGGWRRYTRGPFAQQVMPGHHFYFRQQRQGLMRLVGDTGQDGRRPARP